MDNCISYSKANLSQVAVQWIEKDLFVTMLDAAREEYTSFCSSLNPLPRQGQRLIISINSNYLYHTFRLEQQAKQWEWNRKPLSIPSSIWQPEISNQMLLSVWPTNTITQMQSLQSCLWFSSCVRFSSVTMLYEHIHKEKTITTIHKTIINNKSVDQLIYPFTPLRSEKEKYSISSNEHNVPCQCSMNKITKEKLSQKIT